MGLENIKKTFSDYFHPESLWKQGNIGKVKAVGAVVSWGTLIIPIIMGIGLAISTSCLHTNVKKDRAFFSGVQDATSNKVNDTFEKAKLSPEIQKDSSTAKPNSVISLEDEDLSNQYYNEISTAIERVSKNYKDWDLFLTTVDRVASSLKVEKKINTKEQKIIIPNKDLLENPSDLDGDWIVKAIVWFGGYSIRFSGNVGSYLSLNQTAFYIKELMKREDKVKLIQQIKSELERVEAEAQMFNPCNRVTPYGSIILNLQLLEFEGKKEFLEILNPSDNY